MIVVFSPNDSAGFHSSTLVRCSFRSGIVILYSFVVHVNPYTCLPLICIIFTRSSQFRAEATVTIWIQQTPKSFLQLQGIDCISSFAGVQPCKGM